MIFGIGVDGLGDNPLITLFNLVLRLADDAAISPLFPSTEFLRFQLHRRGLSPNSFIVLWPQWICSRESPEQAYTMLLAQD
jgi:hypothetical protein